jgi:hypothetical protein
MQVVVGRNGVLPDFPGHSATVASRFKDIHIPRVGCVPREVWSGPAKLHCAAKVLLAGQSPTKGEAEACQCARRDCRWRAYARLQKTRSFKSAYV